MIIRILFLILVSLLACRGNVLAWNKSGHMQGAVLAYRQISISTKQKTIEILNSHPSSFAWRQDFEQIRSTLPSDFDLGMYIFMRASIWPDEIRRSESSYDHPKWHFIQYPLEPPDFTHKAALFSDDNALLGIKTSIAALTAEDFSAQRERAIYLSWLIHLIGDIHDPLHCSTLIDKTYPPPSGDKGGNLFYVIMGSQVITLHTFWDNAASKKTNARDIYHSAILLKGRFEKEMISKPDQSEDPEGWSLESRDIAISQVYLEGKLEGGAGPTLARPLSLSYTKQAHRTAMLRIALSGRRLANILEKIL